MLGIKPYLKEIIPQFSLLIREKDYQFEILE